jgi:hypothetical protein
MAATQRERYLDCATVDRGSSRPSENARYKAKRPATNVLSANVSAIHTSLAVSNGGALMVSGALDTVAVMAASSPHGPSVAARSHSNEFSKPPGQMALIRETYVDGDL